MTVASDTTYKPIKRKSRLMDGISRLFKEKPLGTVGLFIVLIFLLAAIFANYLAPYPPNQSNVMIKLSPPSSQHVLGTDNLGRDLLSRIIFGARVSLYVGLGASILNVLVAGIIGLLSGFLGGVFDLFVQRIVDIALSVPSLIILITIVGLIGAGVWQIIIVMGITGGIGWSRVVRSAVLAIRQNVYIDAAKTTGGNMVHIIRRHILPNIMPVTVIIFSVSIAGNILAEAGLSFLGLGIAPPTATWGGMLSKDGRTYMYEAWWLAVFPGLALTAVVYGVNMWGDAIRDLLDPRLRGGVGRYGMALKKEKLKLKQNIT